MNYFTGLVVPLAVIALVLGVLLNRRRKAVAANDGSIGLPSRGRLILIAACIAGMVACSVLWLVRVV